MLIKYKISTNRIREIDEKLFFFLSLRSEKKANTRTYNLFKKQEKKTEKLYQFTSHPSLTRSFKLLEKKYFLVLLLDDCEVTGKEEK